MKRVHSLARASVFFTLSCAIVLSVGIAQDYVYFGDKNKPTVYIYDKASLIQIASLNNTFVTGSVTDMTFFSSDSQPTGTSEYE